MNIRNDIYEKVKFMLKETPDIKINYAKLGRQFNCDPRTVKKHVEAVKEEKPVSTRVYSKKTDGFEQIIEEKVKTGAPAIASESVKSSGIISLVILGFFILISPIFYLMITH